MNQQVASEILERISAKPGAADIENWMIGYVSRVIGVDRSKVDPVRYFNDNGLDSMTTILMTEELGHWLGREIEPTLAYDHPSIQRFSAHLATQGA
jgi:acyl carrier protein